MPRYNNKTYRVDDVAFDQNPKCTFTFHTGEQMSYVDYYRYTQAKKCEESFHVLHIIGFIVISVNYCSFSKIFRAHF